MSLGTAKDSYLNLLASREEQETYADRGSSNQIVSIEGGTSSSSSSSSSSSNACLKNSGFDSDSYYSDYHNGSGELFNFNYDSYAHYHNCHEFYLTILDRKRNRQRQQSRGSFWCCLFPWLSLSSSSSSSSSSSCSSSWNHCSSTVQHELAQPSPSSSSSSRRGSLKLHNDNNHGEDLINKKKKKNVCFAKQAHVFPIRTLKEMTQTETNKVWWQSHDYNAFKRTARLIAQTVCEEGAEAWLTSNQSLSPVLQRTTSDDCIPTQTLQHAIALSMFKQSSGNSSRSSSSSSSSSSSGSSRGSNSGKGTETSTTTFDAQWWHKFGHSRRGLEHIVSPAEGKRREVLSRNAMRCVLDEQRRQRELHDSRNGNYEGGELDMEEIRRVSMQNTGWARDLALAAGASDADAVDKHFDDCVRKSREYYLRQINTSKNRKTTTTTVSTTTFRNHLHGNTANRNGITPQIPSSRKVTPNDYSRSLPFPVQLYPPPPSTPPSPSVSLPSSLSSSGRQSLSYFACKPNLDQSPYHGLGVEARICPVPNSA